MRTHPKHLRWIPLLFLLLLLPGVLFILQLRAALPDTLTTDYGQVPVFSDSGLTVQRMDAVSPANAATGTSTYQAQILLWNKIPLKEITVEETEPTTVLPCGTPFGVKLFTNGVMIVQLSAISTAEGAQSPAEQAGLKPGDLLLSINGTSVTTADQAAALMEASGGNPVTLEIDRNGTQKTVRLTPVVSAFDGSYKSGIWVRDSTAGIGIVTFYCPEQGTFAGLGHAICDVDTNTLLPLRTGEIIPVCINGIVRGTAGTAGQLRGYFSGSDAIGLLRKNKTTGVYGSLSQSPVSATETEVARKQAVHPGTAEILTTIDGTQPARFTVEIESVNLRDDCEEKNLVVHITDSELLAKTGGIVQGMSGSPILQDGKLVGAVTHVLVNDPTRGYGIFAETMLEELNAME